MRIALVDDHALLREGLVALLERARPGVECLQYDGLAPLLEAWPRTAGLSLVLLDLGLPDVQGLAALQQLRAHCEQVPVIVVSADERRDTVMACLEAGASGFIPKTAQFDRLLAQLSAALDGFIQVPPELLTSGAPGAAAAPAFSHRQQQVLDLLLQGMSNKAICRALAMSESTVKTHLAVIFRKLGVSRRAEVMAVAARLGFRLPGWSAASTPARPAAPGD